MSGNKDMSFEDAVERIDEIISRLSEGGAGLEESMGLYCEGAELLVHCEKKLDTARLKTEKLFETNDTEPDDDGM